MLGLGLGLGPGNTVLPYVVRFAVVFFLGGGGGGLFSWEKYFDVMLSVLNVTS